MKIEKISMPTSQEAELTAYLLGTSPEFSNISKRPAVLIFPGGGYQFISDREAEPIAMSYLAEGFNAFVLRYSIGKENDFSNALKDAEEALEMIRDMSDEWNVEQDKVAVVGFSAGGHLAAALGTLSEQRPNALILGYPCMLSSMNHVLAFPVPSLPEKVDELTPPAFIFSTYEDELVPIENSLRFMEALNRKGIPFESHIFQKGGHGLSLAKPLTSSGLKGSVNDDFAKWFSLSVAWLHNVLGDFAVDKESLTLAEVSEYSINVAIGELLDDPQSRELLLSYLPKLEAHPRFEDIREHSLNVLNQFLPQPFSEDQLNEIDKRLKEIPIKQK